MECSEGWILLDKGCRLIGKPHMDTYPHLLVSALDLELLDVLIYNFYVFHSDHAGFSPILLTTLQRIWLHSISMLKHRMQIVWNWQNAFVTLFKFIRMQKNKYENLWR